MTVCEYGYRASQVQLACLDTLAGDFTDYGMCLNLSVNISADLCAIQQMFDAHVAMTLCRPVCWEAES